MHSGRAAAAWVALVLAVAAVADSLPVADSVINLDAAGDTARFGTDASRMLCAEIAAASRSASTDGTSTVILAFSRGKDALASWLYLRQFFDRILPFHCASVPHLPFVDRSLAYYERVFSTAIDRYMNGGVLSAINRRIFQPNEDFDAIEELELPDSFDNRDMAQLVRDKYSISHPPARRAWCAFGINASDSIDRRIYVNKLGGRNSPRRTFYPCFDWSRQQVIDLVLASGIKLPEDYLLANRTLADVPNVRHLERMERQSGPGQRYAEDFSRIESLFPFIRARLARNELRKMRPRERFVGRPEQAREPARESPPLATPPETDSASL